MINKTFFPLKLVNFRKKVNFYWYLTCIDITLNQDCFSTSYTKKLKRKFGLGIILQVSLGVWPC